MGIFGWSLPPGCGSLPGEEDPGPCQVCGKDEDHCICPECPECGTVGDPKCYENHGMIRTIEQIDGFYKIEADQIARFHKENERYDLMKEEEL